MAFYKELRGLPLDATNKCCNDIMARAQQQLGLPREEIILRPLRPEDIGWNPLGVTPKFKVDIKTTLGWNNIVTTYTIEDNRFVCITGVFTEESTPVRVHQIKINRAGSDARIWNVQRVAMQDDSEMHVDDPISIDQNTVLNITGYNGLLTTTAANTWEEFGLIGCVAEKRGMLINPTS